MSNRIRIDQAVFGYRDGHHLIAASLPLAPMTRQSLANITDGSGPESFSGFDGAFTGLPVAQTEFYALFCTWNAPEMPRPGCVWSHVLLIKAGDLALIPDLAELTTLFVRPDSSRPFVGFEQPISLDADIRSHHLSPHPFHGGIAAVLEALYSPLGSDVVVLAAGSEMWNGAVFSIWSQQWPKLRNSFSFSTGSLGDRRLSGIHFDLQVGPLSTARLWSRTLRPTILLDSSNANLTFGHESWLRAVVTDITAEGNSRLREFIRRYGNDTKAGRAALVPLVRLFTETDFEDDDFGQRLVQIAHAFPDPEDALTLKKDRLLIPAEAEENIGDLWSLVYFLICTPEGAAFQNVPVQLEGLVEPLWRRKRADMLALISEVSPSAAVLQFCEGIAQILTPKDVPLLWRENRRAFAKIVGMQPGLANSPGAWELPRSGQKELWALLRNREADREKWASICIAMMKGDCSLQEQETVSLAGDFLEKELLKWTNTASFSLPSQSWRDALGVALQATLRDGADSPRALALAIATAHPSDLHFLSGARSDVQQLAHSELKMLPSDLRLYSSFWLTALGLKTPGELGLNLLSSAFFATYEIVGKSSYPSDAWDALSPVLPRLNFIPEWDRCRKMIHGLRKWLEENEALSPVLVENLPSHVGAKVRKKR